MKYSAARAQVAPGGNNTNAISYLHALMTRWPWRNHLCALTIPEVAESASTCEQNPPLDWRGYPHRSASEWPQSVQLSRAPSLQPPVAQNLAACGLEATHNNLSTSSHLRVEWSSVKLFPHIVATVDSDACHCHEDPSTWGPPQRSMHSTLHSFRLRWSSIWKVQTRHSILSPLLRQLPSHFQNICSSISTFKFRLDAKCGFASE